MKAPDRALLRREGMVLLNEIGVDADPMKAMAAIRLGQEAARVLVLHRRQRDEARRGEGLDQNAVHHPPRDDPAARHPVRLSHAR